MQSFQCNLFLQSAFKQSRRLSTFCCIEEMQLKISPFISHARNYPPTWKPYFWRATCQHDRNYVNCVQLTKTLQHDNIMLINNNLLIHYVLFMHAAHRSFCIIACVYSGACAHVHIKTFLARKKISFNKGNMHPHSYRSLRKVFIIGWSSPQIFVNSLNHIPI